LVSETFGTGARSTGSLAGDDCEVVVVVVDLYARRAAVGARKARGLRRVRTNITAVVGVQSGCQLVLWSVGCRVVVKSSSAELPCQRWWR